MENFIFCAVYVPEKHSDILRTTPYSPTYKAKGRIRGEISLGRTRDVNLTIINKMGFHGIFSVFPGSNCISDIAMPK